MPRILVVEDEMLIAMLVEDWLAELKCETVGPTGSAAEALALIEDGELDGAILDVSLDGHDSFPIADALRVRNVPFVFATGHGFGHIAERFKDAPTLTKPYDFERVRATVATLLERSAAGSRRAG
ncbi:MAG TPA: response regulator [Xanthobacteraceae bacterium]|jgi:DNA-binding response OmpR family regulator|nr:response regulator [Xanthobacteraceae bacterium]